MAAFLSTVLFKTIVVIRGLLIGASVRSISVSLALFHDPLERLLEKTISHNS